MKNSRTLVLTVIFALIIGGGIVGYCIGNRQQPKQVTFDYPDTSDYKTGEIIVPDYVNADSLIVMDGKGLTAAIDSLLHSDGGGDLDCNNVLHSSNSQGLKYCMTFDEYLEFLDGEGYRADIALHIAFVDFKILKADSLYTAIMED